MEVDGDLSVSVEGMWTKSRHFSSLFGVILFFEALMKSFRYERKIKLSSTVQINESVLTVLLYLQI